jgi:hypothetical protein
MALELGGAHTATDVLIVISSQLHQSIAPIAKSTLATPSLSGDTLSCIR